MKPGFIFAVAKLPLELGPLLYGLDSMTVSRTRLSPRCQRSCYAGVQPAVIDVATFQAGLRLEVAKRIVAGALREDSVLREEIAEKRYASAKRAMKK